MNFAHNPNYGYNGKKSVVLIIDSGVFLNLFNKLVLIISLNFDIFNGDNNSSFFRS